MSASMTMVDLLRFVWLWDEATARAAWTTYCNGTPVLAGDRRVGAVSTLWHYSSWCRSDPGRPDRRCVNLEELTPWARQVRDGFVAGRWIL